jgi:glycosyltransferase involved in cell wall biosynthesis
MPPERTGIADYSSELLPALAEHYAIEVVVAQDHVDDPWVHRHGKVQDVAWFRAHAREFDHVLYQVGNSPFHRHMLALLQEIPGTVVLHDFYLSGLIAWLELQGGEPHAWVRALYESHGYGAVRDRYRNAEDAKRRYPVNWHILQHAQGVIVHSSYSHSLAQHWYGKLGTAEWTMIPLLRSPAQGIDKQAARQQLGIDARDYVICSFGFLDETKQNHSLLQAWLRSALAADKRCRLIFVGENNGGAYGRTLLQTMRECGFGDRIHITGFAASETFRQYLTAADLAVQLRRHSRGETSAAVLDCMNHALPLIVNANGSMAELAPEAVWMLPDEFTETALVEALETLWRNPEHRRTLGERAQAAIHERHSPQECARRYAQAIENAHQRGATAVPALLEAIAAQPNVAFDDDAALLHLSQTIAGSLPLPRSAKRLFLDISATCRHDLKTGVERVARALLMALLESPPVGYRIEPVYLTDEGGAWHHRYARGYILGLLGCPMDALKDERLAPENGDVILVLDISGDTLVQAERAGVFQNYRNHGVSLHSIVYDLLPVRMPQVFPPGADESHAKWLQAVSSFDGAVCISKAVADDLAQWREETGIDRQSGRHYHIGWWHLGADVVNSAPSHGVPENAEKVLARLSSRPSFLMVGTIEPRKGYLQTLEAFDALWAKGLDINLVIVGREGWQGLPPQARRDIPTTIQQLSMHPQRDQRLFWMDGISDEYLQNIYTASTCLLAASHGEGFGLPLIEAALHGLPILARDLSVFREVAGAHASYFQASAAPELAAAIQAWLQACERGEHTQSSGLPWVTWSESADQLAAACLGRPASTLGLKVRA